MDDDTAVVERDSGPPPKIVVFYSYTGGVGRSATVANLAVILANGGYRVLVVDLDSGAPTQHRYLRPFIPEGVTSARISAPLALDCAFAHERGALDFAGPLADLTPAADPLTVDRESLLAAPYDLILVDAPNGRSSQAESAIDLADLLVLQYSPDMQSIQGGIQVARAAEARLGRAVGIIPVPMYFDQRAGGYAERTRTAARQLLATSLDNHAQDTGGQGLEIPYVSDYAVDIRLVILDSPSETRDSLLERYRQLAAAVADIQVAELEPVELPLHASRNRYLARYGVTEPHILCVPGDRIWAEWAVDALNRVGITARYACLDAETTAKLGEMTSIAFVASEAFLRSPSGAETIDRLVALAAGGSNTVLALDVDGSGAAATMAAQVSVLPLFGLEEEEANAQLLGFYSPPGWQADQGGDAPIRFPAARRSPLSNLPPRIADFAGRDDELERIRDHLVGDGGGRPFRVVGDPAIGKSALVREYAHRFASQYDIIWTIPAHSDRMIRRGLGELATKNGLSRRGNAPVAVLDLLAREQQRWLLIYEGLDNPADLVGLLPPPSTGHVLITSRHVSPDDTDQALLGPLDRAHALDLIAELLPEDLEASRMQLCDALPSAEPMAVRLAATWVRERARTMVGGLADISFGSGAAIGELEESLRTADPDSELLAEAVKLLMSQLESASLGAVALRILRTCAFMSQAGVSRSLLESPAFLADLGQAASEIVEDPIVLNTVLYTLTRHGFLPAHQALQPTVLVHRRLLEIVTTTMSPEEIEERKSAVHRILAAYAPQDAQRVTLARYPVYFELQRHLDVVDPSADLDPRVRRWLLGQIDFLYSRMEAGPWALADQWGELLERTWGAALADPDADPSDTTDRFLLELRFHRANVARARGDFQKAYDLDSKTLAQQRVVSGVEHPRTLMVARGTAADLRLLGKFDDARSLETSTWQAFRQELGDDHEMTVTTASNLALSETLTGSAQRALERETEVLRRSVQMAGRYAEYPAWALAHMGWHLRELGRYKKSRDRIVEARDQLDVLMRDEILSPMMKIVLTTDASLTATERRLAPPTPGFVNPLVRDALHKAEEAFGKRDFVVLALRSAVAAAEHSAGLHDEALATALECHTTATVLFGEGHPFVGVCATNLGAYTSSVQGPAEAERWGEKGLSTFTGALGEDHPWTLIARLGLDWTRTLMGRETDTEAALEDAVNEFLFTNGSHHPVNRAYEFFRRNSRAASLRGECDHVFELELPLYI